MFELTGNLQNGSPDDVVAIDDIFFSVGSCSDSLQVNKLCTFSDESLCGFELDVTSSFTWKTYLPPVTLKLEDELKQVMGPLPILDHTSEGIGSGYAYADASGIRYGYTTTLKSPLYKPFAPSVNYSGQCLEFYFYLQGSDAVALNVKARQNGSFNEPLLWTRSNDHSGAWWKGEVNIKFFNDFKIYFEALALNDTLKGIVALDDIMLKNGDCSRYHIIANQFNFILT